MPDSQAKQLVRHESGACTVVWGCSARLQTQTRPESLVLDRFSGTSCLTGAANESMESGARICNPYLVADGQGEPVCDGHFGVQDLRQVPGVGVGGPREAHVDVDGAAVLRVHPAQRCADGAAPVASCAQHRKSGTYRTQVT